jgi:hypothetical protein
MWNGWSGSWTLMLCYSNLQRSRQESLSSTSRLCQDRLHGLRSVHMTNTDRRWPHNPTTSSLQCGRVLNTNSTAQGGGGSFKNRKPIGEIGCCESRMAERIHCWTKRWLECRIIHLSIYLSIHPSIYLYFFSLYWSICLSTYPSLSLSIHLLSSLSVHAAVHPSSYFVYVSICLSFFLFLSFEICPFPHLSICLSTQFDSKPVTLAQKRNRANRPGFQLWCNLQNLKCETSLLASAPAFAYFHQITSRRHTTNSNIYT